MLYLHFGIRENCLQGQLHDFCAVLVVYAGTVKKYFFYVLHFEFRRQLFLHNGFDFFCCMEEGAEPYGVFQLLIASAMQQQRFALHFGHAHQRGFGRRMMEQVMARLYERGSPGGHLGVFRANTRAMGFYQALGFRELVCVGMGPDACVYFGRDFGP